MSMDPRKFLNGIAAAAVAAPVVGCVPQWKEAISQEWVNKWLSQSLHILNTTPCIPSEYLELMEFARSKIINVTGINRELLGIAS